MQKDQAIAKAHELEKQIDGLVKEQHRLLDPICKEAVDSKDEDKIKALIEKLPPGYHRTELRVFLKTIPKCCVCGTKEGLHKDGWYGYRCDSPDCVAF